MCARCVGDPRRNLLGSTQEAKHVAAAMTSHSVNPLLLLHENATKIQVLSAMDTSDYIHFSAHGGHDFVELEGSTHLTVLDIEPGSLARVKLVVMAACNTWKGKIRADGVYGLVRAFTAAGASSIIATLWAIEDDDTEFIHAFYSFLFSPATTPAEAYQAAIRKLINEGVSHSKWAPFVVLYDAKHGQGSCVDATAT